MCDQRKTLEDASNIWYLTISEWQEGASYALSEEEGVEAQGYSLVDRKSSTRSRFKTSIFEESKKKRKTTVAGHNGPGGKVNMLR